MSDEAELEAQARERIGTVLRGKYRIDGVLGIGGMAVVYKATHRNKAEFALKMLHPELSRRESVRQRFLREGYSANSVKHPGAVKVVDDDIAEDGAAFLVMELLDGLSADRLHELPSVRAAATIVVQLLEVLTAAHAAGIVHRDIKPANLFLTRDGTVKVLDFGIARALDDAPGSAQLTGAGMPLGTPAFMAPEQALAKSSEIDARTDVWAAGATLFTLLTGEMVHSGEVASQVLIAAATSPARSLTSMAPAVPAPIAEVVDRALQFDRTARWPTAIAMRDALVAACLVAGVGAPEKATLAALFAGVRGTTGISDPVAFLPTAESGPAPPRKTGPREATAPAVSSTPHPGQQSETKRAPKRGWKVAVALGAAIVLLGTVRVGVKAFRARAHHPVSPTPSASASAALPARNLSHGTVLVLGMENQTFDPLFDGTLDVVLGKALGRSPSIATFAATSLQSLAAELDAEPQRVDEGLAQKLLSRDKGEVITVRGTAAPKGEGYSLSITARDARSGAVVFSGTRDAADGTGVVPSLGRLACDLRGALGDPPPTEPKLAEQTGLSPSLEADHEYVLGTRFNKVGKNEAGIPYLRRAVALDPRFARAHHALAAILWSLGRRAESEKETELAEKWSDTLGDIDRVSLKGEHFETIGDYDRAIASFEEVLQKRPGEIEAKTCLADLYWETHQPQRALERARLTVTEHPTGASARLRLALIELRESELDHVVDDTRKIFAAFPRPPLQAYVYLALAEALRGDRAPAGVTYRKLIEHDASLANHGLADLALAEGRLSDAGELIRHGLAADITEKNGDASGRKRVLLADVRLRRGDRAGALEVARKAAASKEPGTLYGAGEIDLAANDPTSALAIVAELQKNPSREARIYETVLEADALRAGGKAREALAKLEEAKGVGDAWLGRVAMARAHLELGENAEAERELRDCIARSGEGALALSDVAPSARLVPPLTYYLARALEGQGRPEAKATYEAFLGLLSRVTLDPLAADARRRVAGGAAPPP